MKGSRLPIAVAHGEGRAQFKSPEDQKDFELDVIHYIDNYGNQRKLIHLILMDHLMLLLV